MNRLIIENNPSDYPVNALKVAYIKFFIDGWYCWRNKVTNKHSVNLDSLIVCNFSRLLGKYIFVLGSTSKATFYDLGSMWEGRVSRETDEDFVLVHTTAHTYEYSHQHGQGSETFYNLFFMTNVPFVSYVINISSSLIPDRNKNFPILEEFYSGLCRPPRCVIYVGTA